MQNTNQANRKNKPEKKNGKAKEKHIEKESEATR